MVRKNRLIKDTFQKNYEKEIDRFDKDVNTIDEEYNKKIDSVV